MGQILFHPSSARGHHDHGWLDTWHSFSFAMWYEPKRMGFGSLRVLNDDFVQGGRGFGTHPHDNMEIISIPLRGALEHADSMGNRTVITADEVQRMSAGTGVFHSEKNHSPDEPVNFLQIWIFPEHRDLPPSYDQKRFNPSERRNRLQLLVSPDGAENSVTLGAQARLSRGDFEGGHNFTLAPHRTGNGLYVFVLEGAADSVRISGQSLGRRDAAGISVESAQVEILSPASLLVLDVPPAPPEA